MKKPYKLSANQHFWIFWGLCGGFEILFLFFLLQTPPHFLGLVFSHGIACFFIFIAPPKRGGYWSPLRHWGEPCAFWTFIFPGVGWFFTGFFWFYRDFPNALKEISWEEDVALEEEEEGLLLDRVLTVQELEREVLERSDMMSAVDTLLGSNAALKRGAIQTLARLKTPEAIHWLLKARSDPSPEVRFGVTSALTTLKRDYEHSIRAVEQELVNKPTDPKPQMVFYEILYEYALSGLVEKERKEKILTQCHVGLQELSQQHPSALPLLFQVEKVHSPVQALQVLERLETQFPEEGVQWLKERIFLLFELGQYDQVRNVLGQLNEIYKKTSEGASESLEDFKWKSFILWWGYA